MEGGQEIKDLGSKEEEKAPAAPANRFSAMPASRLCSELLSRMLPPWDARPEQKGPGALGRHAGQAARTAGPDLFYREVLHSQDSPHPHPSPKSPLSSCFSRFLPPPQHLGILGCLFTAVPKSQFSAAAGQTEGRLDGSLPCQSRLGYGSL